MAALVLLSLAAARVVWTALVYFQSGRYARHRVESAWMVFVALGVLVAALPSPQPGIRPAIDLDSTRRRRGAYVASLAGAMAASVILYWPALSIGLLSDDFVLLGRSVSEIVSPRAWELYRPFPLLLWKVLFPIGDAAALHLLNILLHGVNAWLVARLVLRLGHTALVSAGVGFMFLAFPAVVEPVAWNSGIFDVGMVTLGLLYLHACAAGHSLVTSTLLLTAALLTKETAVALPLIAAILCLLTRIPARTLLASAGVTAAYIILRVSTGASMPRREPAMLRYAVKEVVVRPFASLGIPWTGQELAAHPLMLGVVTASVLTTLVYLYCLRPSVGARVVVGPAIVLAGVLPLWQVMFVSDDLGGSRYLYLPLVGWSLVLADLIAHRGAGRIRMYTLAVIALLAAAGVWGVREHLAPWQEAARTRDMVIRSAREQLALSRCGDIRFENVPASVAGAQVFRNGLPQALHHANPSDPGFVPPCTFAWSDGRFLKVQ